jgi:hypothetical protein
LHYVFCKSRQKREPTSGLEPLTCSLRVSLFPFRILLEMVVLQVFVNLSYPPRIGEYRQVSPLLLTLLLTTTHNDSKLDSDPSPRTVQYVHVVVHRAQPGGAIGSRAPERLGSSRPTQDPA